MRGSGIKTIKFECKRNHLTLRGTHFRPQGEQLPIAIVSHGFMANQRSVRRYARALAEMGYAAFCFDFSGGCAFFGKSDGKSTDMSVLTEVSDLEAVAAYARALPYTKSDELLLMGCSQGGFVSALAAAKADNNVSKLILFYPALCIPDDARAGQMMFAKFDPEHIPEQFMCGPMRLSSRYVTDVINMKPGEEIKHYPGDVLIVHGDKDPVVSIHYSNRAYKTYLKRTAAKFHRPPRTVFRTIEGGKHGFSRKHDVLAMDAVRSFLSE